MLLPANLYNLESASPSSFFNLKNCSSVKPIRRKHSCGTNLLILPLCIIPCLSTTVMQNAGAPFSLTLGPFCLIFSLSGLITGYTPSSSTKTPECSPLRLLKPALCLAVIHRAVSVIFEFSFISTKYIPVLPPNPPQEAVSVMAAPFASYTLLPSEALSVSSERGVELFLSRGNISPAHRGSRYPTMNTRFLLWGR